MEQVAIVTGGASGIGLALGTALVTRGWHVVLADLQRAPLVAEQPLLPIDPFDLVILVNHRVGADHVEVQVVSQVMAVFSRAQRAGHARVDPQLGDGDPVGQAML